MTTTMNFADLSEFEAHLQKHLNGQIHDLRLVCRGDGLVLQGRARTYYAKESAWVTSWSDCSRLAARQKRGQPQRRGQAF
jgi:hypothetical protein